jgi:hypothetical protein
LKSMVNGTRALAILAIITLLSVGSYALDDQKKGGRERPPKEPMVFLKEAKKDERDRDKGEGKQDRDKEKREKGKR